MNNKEIIYVNGCSYAEGCDIGEHLYPFFKKYYSYNEFISQKVKTMERIQMSQLQNKNKFVETSANHELVESIFQYEAEKRWSSQLADILGRSVVNISSQGGASMFAIAHRTMADLSALQQQGHTISDVIIQLTFPGRYSFFGQVDDRCEPQLIRNGRYYHVKSGSLLNPQNLRRSLLEEICYEETQEMSLYRWLHEVYMLKHAIEAVTQARVIFVDSAFYLKDFYGPSHFRFTLQSHWLKKNSQDYLLDFKKTLDEEVKLSMLIVIDPDEPDTVTASMHVTEKVHKKFAEQIAERYFK
jgi:hypothetical protein